MIVNQEAAGPNPVGNAEKEMCSHPGCHYVACHHCTDCGRPICVPHASIVVGTRVIPARFICKVCDKGRYRPL